MGTLSSPQRALVIPPVRNGMRRPSPLHKSPRGTTLEKNSCHWGREWSWGRTRLLFSFNLKNKMFLLLAGRTRWEPEEPESFLFLLSTCSSAVGVTLSPQTEASPNSATHPRPHTILKSLPYSCISPTGSCIHDIAPLLW